MPEHVFPFIILFLVHTSWIQSNGVYKLGFFKYLVSKTVTLKMFTERSLTFSPFLRKFFVVIVHKNLVISISQVSVNSLDCFLTRVVPSRNHVNAGSQSWRSDLAAAPCCSLLGGFSLMSPGNTPTVRRLWPSERSVGPSVQHPCAFRWLSLPGWEWFPEDEFPSGATVIWPDILLPLLLFLLSGCKIETEQDRLWP